MTAAPNRRVTQGERSTAAADGDHQHVAQHRAEGRGLPGQALRTSRAPSSERPATSAAAPSTNPRMESWKTNSQRRSWKTPKGPGAVTWPARPIPERSAESGQHPHLRQGQADGQRQQEPALPEPGWRFRSRPSAPILRPGPARRRRAA